MKRKPVVPLAQVRRVLFGLGALGGPILNGYLADRFGFALVLRIGFLVEAAAVLMPALSSGTVWLALSSVVIGAFTPGIVPLVLGRLHELLTHHPAAQKGGLEQGDGEFRNIPGWFSLRLVIHLRTN
jgi:predicted MFS family arabinose efflux permease